jgi:hypothetical protein
LMLVASTDIIIALFVSPRHFRFKELRNDPNFMWQKLSNSASITYPGVLIANDLCSLSVGPEHTRR